MAHGGPEGPQSAICKLETQKAVGVIPSTSTGLRTTQHCCPRPGENTWPGSEGEVNLALPLSFCSVTSSTGWWSLPTLGRPICFTQFTNPSAGSSRNTLPNTQKQALLAHLASLSPVRRTGSITCQRPSFSHSTGTSLMHHWKAGWQAADNLNLSVSLISLK